MTTLMEITIFTGFLAPWIAWGANTPPPYSALAGRARQARKSNLHSIFQGNTNIQEFNVFNLNLTSVWRLWLPARFPHVCTGWHRNVSLWNTRESKSCERCPSTSSGSSEHPHRQSRKESRCPTAASFSSPSSNYGSESVFLTHPERHTFSEAHTPRAQSP